MNTVFLLQHLHVHVSGSEDLKIIGIDTSSDVARKAISRLVRQPGFRDFPQLIDPTISDCESGFYLDEYRLDEDNWAEGFG